MSYLFLNIALIAFYPILISIFLKKEKAKRAFLKIAFIQLIIFHTFIELDWVDLPSYKMMFDDISSMGINDMISSQYIIEPAFYLLMKLVSMISLNFHVFLFVMSILVIGSYFKTIKRYSPNYIFSILFILVTVYNPSLMILRQGLALALITLTYPYVIRRELKKFLCLFFVAFLIHQSCVVFLPVYFVYGIKNLRNFHIIISISAIIMGVSFKFLFTYFGSIIFSKYADYITSSNSVLINSTRLFIVLSVSLAYVFCLKKDLFKDGINKLVYTLLVFGVFGSFFGIGLPESDRLFQYYTTCTFLAIPIAGSYVKNMAIARMFMMITFLLFFYVAFNNNEYLTTLRYLF